LSLARGERAQSGRHSLARRWLPASSKQARERPAGDAATHRPPASHRPDRAHEPAFAHHHSTSRCLIARVTNLPLIAHQKRPRGSLTPTPFTTNKPTRKKQKEKPSGHRAHEPAFARPAGRPPAGATGCLQHVFLVPGWLDWSLARWLRASQRGANSMAGQSDILCSIRQKYRHNTDTIYRHNTDTIPT
jgi:hypothetical protein